MLSYPLFGLGDMARSDEKEDANDDENQVGVRVLGETAPRSRSHPRPLCGRSSVVSLMATKRGKVGKIAAESKALTVPVDVLMSVSQQHTRRDWMQ